MNDKISHKKFTNLPDFCFEKKLWSRGMGLVAGMDEVGRGSFAGPVVASAVAFAPNSLRTTRFVAGDPQSPIINENGKKIYINDSKKLTEKRREEACEWIIENAVSVGVGQGSVDEINKKGMSKATSSAFRRAVRGVHNDNNQRVDYLLIDAFFIPYIRDFPTGRKIKDLSKNLNDGSAKQLAVKNGDSRSFSIAAASIVAKVERDRLMVKIGQKTSNKKYAWHKNKGYGTREHRDAIIRHGITKHHRKEFVKTFLNKMAED